MKLLILVIILVLGSCGGSLHKTDKAQRLEGLLQKGFQSDAREDYRSSLKIYDSILKEQPSQYIALVNRGRAKVSLGDTLSGIVDLDSSIKIHPTPEAFASKAMAELYINPDQALKDLTTGDQAFPKRALLNIVLTEYFTSIHPDRAKASYYAEYTCKLSIPNPSYYFVIMNTYLFCDDYFHLLQITDSLIKNFPVSPYPYNNRGWAELNLGEIQQAKRDILKSIELDSTNAWAYRNMSLVFEKMKISDSSCFYAQLAKKKDKKQQYQKDIDSLILRVCGKKSKPIAYGL